MTITSSVNDSNPSSALFASLNGTGATTDSSKSSAAQSRFLKLLTAQLKNQDPLNPLDNAQMTSQLAQISTVDGIERLNSTLQTLIGNSNDSQALQAAALLGHGVLVPGTTLGLTNGSAFAGFDLSGDADKVTVTIKDSNGLVMRTMELGSIKAGSHPFSWDGNTDAGIPAVNGNYSFSVAATQGTDKITTAALSLGLVSSVSRSASGLTLNIGQQTFNLSDVRQIL